MTGAGALAGSASYRRVSGRESNSPQIRALICGIGLASQASHESHLSLSYTSLSLSFFLVNSTDRRCDFYLASSPSSSSQVRGHKCGELDFGPLTRLTRRRRHAGESAGQVTTAQQTPPNDRERKSDDDRPPRRPRLHRLRRPRPRPGGCRPRSLGDITPLPCPACGLDAVYAAGIDRYVHVDSRHPNGRCWLKHLRGDTDPVIHRRNDAYLARRPKRRRSAA